MVNFKIRERVGKKGISFMVDICLPDGSRPRVTRSTEAEAKAEAQKIIEMFEKRKAAQLLGVVLDAKDSSTHGLKKQVKLSQVIRDHLAEREQQIVDHYNVQAFKYVMNYIYDGLFDLGVDYVHQIDLQKVEALRLAWKRKGLSNTTVNRRIGALKSLLNHCEAWGYIPKNPVARIKPLTNEYVERRPWTSEEFVSVLKILPEWCANVFTFIYEIGCRPKEAVNLRERDLDFKTESVTLFTRKGGMLSTRTIPLTKNQFQFLANVLAERKKIYPNSELVFVNKKGNKIYQHRISDEIRKARRHLKLSEDLIPYGTRHGMITMLQDMDVGLAKVQEIAGHKRADTTKRYTHLKHESIRQVLYLAEERRKKEMQELENKKRKEA